MVTEVVEVLQPGRGGLFVDCTVGLGGHAAALLDAGAGRVLGLDRDPAALAHAGRRLEGFGDRVTLVHADYRDLGSVLDVRGIDVVDGVLADLGASSLQLDTAERGFSFRLDGPLDMRMDTTSGETAADVVARTPEAELADVIYGFGEERFSRRIARALVRSRELAPIATTSQLAAIVRRAVPVRGYQRIDPATRTFQALRIRVNHELERLDRFLGEALARLRASGRLAVIAFHSLEDRIVKHTFRALEQAAAVPCRVLTRRPATPGPAECERNPRARSARLRAIERTA
jgi:16S rRNA (cytosine1402-N4)-methyltransferase